MNLIQSSMEQIALEAISFQSPDLSNKIIACFEKILANKGAPSEIQKMAEVQEILDVVFKHTGVRLRLILDTSNPPCVLPPYINPNSILLPDYAKGMIMDDYNTILAKLEKEKQTTFIDLKNCRVGGLYSKIESPIYMSMDFLRDVKLNAREATAVFMHELGHVFVSYEMTYRTVTGNQIMAAIAKSVKANGNSPEHRIVLKKAGKALGNEEAFLELTEVKDQNLITTVVLSSVKTQAASELGTKYYDATSFEALADNFAARHGLSRDLVTGLVKLGKHYGLPEYSKAVRIALLIFQVVVFVAMPLSNIITVITLGVGSPINAVLVSLSIIASAFAWYYAGDAKRDYTYDDTKIRFQRIREQCITLLKNDALSKDDVNVQVKNIDVIDKAIAELYDYKGMMRTVMNFLIPANRRAVNAIEVQRQLEELAANDIYLKAAQLRGV